MRPTIQVGVALLGAAIILAPNAGRAQLTRISQIIDEPSPLLHSGGPAQGYLGVLVGDIDNDSASKLKLKDVRGAVVTLIDHDAPAAQVGLRVNDVLLEVNGQAVESAEAFGRMMREIPPGRKITLVVSRDGSTQTMTVQLVDRKKLDTDIWNKLNSGSDISSPATGLGILGTGAGGDARPAAAIAIGPIWIRKARSYSRDRRAIASSSVSQSTALMSFISLRTGPPPASMRQKCTTLEPPRES